MTKTTRRDFLKRAGVAIALSSVSGLEVLAQSPHEKNYTLHDYVNALIKVESHCDPKAERYEPKLKDWSYGLGQILTETAKETEGKHPSLPRLGETLEEIKTSLLNPEINRRYTTTIFKEELDFYENPFVAVAAYNSGHFTPRSARYQEQINDLLGTNLKTDGLIGKKTRIAVKQFQFQYGLSVDGKIGPNTRQELNKIWTQKFPEQQNSKGVIPQNGFTPHHVEKFREALENPK